MAVVILDPSMHCIACVLAAGYLHPGALRPAPMALHDPKTSSLDCVGRGSDLWAHGRASTRQAAHALVSMPVLAMPCCLYRRLPWHHHPGWLDGGEPAPRDHPCRSGAIACDHPGWLDGGEPAPRDHPCRSEPPHGLILLIASSARNRWDTVDPMGYEITIASETGSHSIPVDTLAEAVAHVQGLDVAADVVDVEAAIARRGEWRSLRGRWHGTASFKIRPTS